MDDGEDYEWDDDKRRINLAKHGVDFADAEALDWSLALTLQDRDSSIGEERFITIAPIYGRLHFMAWTERNGVCRIISLRKTNRAETRMYEDGDG